MYKIVLKDENPQNVAGLSHKQVFTTPSVAFFGNREQPLPYWLQNKNCFFNQRLLKVR